MRTYRWCMFVVLAALAGAALAHAQTDPSDLLRKAKAALARGEAEQALTLAGMAVARAPDEPAARLVRGAAYEALQRHAEAIADFDAVLRRDPKLADAYQHRGSEHFKLGHIRESLADFDKYLELKPQARPGHWQRGISCYYAGQYDEGRKQFEGYEAVDTNDVENAVWHCLCLARAVGLEKARVSMLKIGRDKRVPLMELYALFQGRATPDDVLKAARAGDPPAKELRQRLFYAHLYLGLYAEAAGDPPKALAHLEKAAGDYRWDAHYMGDVARVHRDILRKTLKK